jgi:predicted ATP-grasp superfamily ATP-dependent carboligase
MKKHNAIVIGCYVGGIGVIRSLANKGINIIALSYEKVDFAHRSKYVNEWYRIPHPRTNEKEFIDFLLSKSSLWKDAVIFDTDDNIATALSKNKHILSKFYKIVTADYDKMSLFINKNEAWKLALENNILHPANYTPTTKEQFNDIITKVNFPCLLKPVKGHEFRGKFNVKNFEVNNIYEYNKYVDLCLRENQPVMVQEIIPGPDTLLYKCMTYINSNGGSAGYFFYNKLRQNPPGFGVIRVCKSAPYNEEVAILFDKIL